jgi:RNA polymerase sigma factor (sigma-70 family)
MASAFIQTVRVLIAPPDNAAAPDRELLARFVARGDEAAFAALIKRHGPMVLGVCRRLLRCANDVEDAFQATFLVFVQKARTLGNPNLLGNWLYGVAYRTAQKARAAAQERRQRENAAAGTRPGFVSDPPADDLTSVVDEEVSRLPEKYRAPFVLCCLQGKTNDAAARLLGCPHGTVLSRLARARQRLRASLTRRGLAPAAGLGALLIEENLASSAVPVPLLTAGIETALQFAAGRTRAQASTVMLAKGVMQAMFLTKLKTPTVLICALAVACGAGFPLYRIVAAPGTGQKAASAVPSARTKSQTGEEAPGPRAPEPVLPSLPALSIEEISIDEGGSAKTIKGSGKLASKEFKVGSFSAVAAGHAFQVEIVKGDTHGAKITVDDNITDDVSVVKDGTTLRIGLDGKDKSYRDVHLKAIVTMPRLDAINLDGACHATVAELKATKAFTAILNGASHLDGTIKADKATLSLSGASRMKLKGSAKEATLKGSGASVFELKEFTLASVSAHLSGASRATVQVKERLDYDLSGASTLRYQGNPTIGKKSKTGASRVQAEKSQGGDD